MKRTLLAITFAVSACATTPAPAPAPAPGAELAGRSLRVEIEGGPTMTLRFQPGGTVIGNNAGREATGRWEVEDGRLCLQFPGQERDCWPYAAPFVGGKPVTLTSTGGVTARATLID